MSQPLYLYREGAGIEGKWIWCHILLWQWQQGTWTKKYIEVVFRLSRTEYLLLINDVCSGHGMERRCCVLSWLPLSWFFDFGETHILDLKFLGAANVHNDMTSLDQI